MKTGDTNAIGFPYQRKQRIPSVHPFQRRLTGVLFQGFSATHLRSKNPFIWSHIIDNFQKSLLNIWKTPLKNSILARRGTAVLIASLVAGIVTLLLSAWVNDRHIVASTNTENVKSSLREDGVFSPGDTSQTCNKISCSRFTTWQFSDKDLICREYDNAFYQFGSEKPQQFLEAYSKSSCEKNVEKWKSALHSEKIWSGFSIAATGLNIISLLSIIAGFGTVLYAGLRALWGKTE